MSIKYEADTNVIDDMTLTDVKMLRVERMDFGLYWMWVQLADGREIHFDITRAKQRPVDVTTRDGRIEP